MFDPLHKWLGIPPSEQPGNHYRLLGITEFESDEDVIDAAADKQLSFLHNLINGEHGEAASELSNRVARARVVLLNAKRKAAYDQSLRALQPAKAPAKPTSSGWMLRHSDGIEHGPFETKQLVDAARLGNIVAQTQVRHAVLTGEQWVLATTRPEISDPLSEPHAADSATLSTATVSQTAAPVSSSPISPTIRAKPTKNRQTNFFAIASRVVFSLMWISIPVGMIYFNPRLRQLFFGEPVAAPAVATPRPSVHREQRPEPRPQATVKESLPVYPERDPVRMDSIPVEPSPSITTEPEPTDSPKETLVRLKLELDSRRWVGPIPDANDTDSFFVESVSGGGVSVHVFPTDGKLSYNQPLTISFNNMQGLTMDLRLDKTGKEKTLSLLGDWIVKTTDSKKTPFSDVRMRTRLRFLQKQSASSAQLINQLTYERNQKKLFIESRGLKTLAAVNQAENRIKVIDSQLPSVQQQSEANKLMVDQFSDFVAQVDRIHSESEIVIRCLAEQ